LKLFEETGHLMRAGALQHRLEASVRQERKMERVVKRYGSKWADRALKARSEQRDHEPAFAVLHRDGGSARTMFMLGIGQLCGLQRSPAYRMPREWGPST